MKGFPQAASAALIAWCLAVVASPAAMAGKKAPPRLSAVASAAVGQEVSLPVDGVRPTQMAIGREDAAEMLVRYVQEARGRRNRPDTDRLEAPQDPGIYIQRSLEARPFPGIIMPDGQVYITDGHHRAVMVSLAGRRPDLVARLGGKREFSVRVAIERNFLAEGLDWEGACRELYANGQVYFPKNVRAEIDAGTLTAGAAFRRHIPPSLRGLADSPLRSLIGSVFQETGIESKSYIEYIEFYLGERLQEQGLHIPADANVGDVRLKARIREMMAQPENATFLKNSMRRSRVSCAAAIRGVLLKP